MIEKKIFLNEYLDKAGKKWLINAHAAYRVKQESINGQDISFYLSIFFSFSPIPAKGSSSSSVQGVTACCEFQMEFNILSMSMWVAWPVRLFEE